MTDFKVHDVRGRFPVLPSHVHAYVVELPESVVIVDGTAAISSGKQVRELADSLGKPVEAVLMTHGHPDHFTGLVAMADLPRYATQGTIDFAHHEDETKWESGKMYLGDDFPDERVFPNIVVRDGDVKTFSGVDFTLVHLGPGESDDDNAWIADVDGVQHAFIGDAICYGTHAFFGDGHALHWLENLNCLERLLRPNAKLYVGHGDSPVGVEAIADQRAYINKFLDTIRDLEREHPVSQATVEKVMGVMKAYQPTDMLFFLLGYELEQGIERVWNKLDAQA